MLRPARHHRRRARHAQARNQGGHARCAARKMATGARDRMIPVPARCNIKIGAALKKIPHSQSVSRNTCVSSIKKTRT